MAALHRPSKAYLNTSFKLRRNAAALNTSRKILQKSVNRSILCASSLKSNNASLAKKVAELQMELSVQRTAAQEAAIESCRLQMQIARLQPLVEARVRLQESLLELREHLATMLDTDMAIMRCVNDISSIVDGSGDGSDQSVCTNTNWFADTILEMSNLLQPNKRLQEASRIVPSPILPPKGYRPLNRRRDPFTQTNPLSKLSDITTTTQLTSLPYSNALTSPIFTSCTSTAQLSPDEAVHSVIPIQLMPQQSSVTVNTNFSDPGIATSGEPPPQIPSNQAERSPDRNSVQQPDSLEPSSLFGSTNQCTVPLIKVNDHVSVQPPVSEAELNTSNSSESEPGKRVRPVRQAQLKAKPIIDISVSLANDADEIITRKPKGKRRRRLIHTDDDDEDATDKPTKKRHTTKSHTKQRNEEPHLLAGGRVVEVQMQKPGKVAFRADARHAPSAPVGSQSRGKELTRNCEGKNTKSVFDLSANQTINMSVLPPTLNELRQREQAKKEAQQAPSSSISAETKSNHQAETQKSVSSERCISVALSPLKNLQCENGTQAEPRVVLTEMNVQHPSTRSFRRRLICADDDKYLPRNQSNRAARKHSASKSTENENVPITSNSRPKNI